MKNREILYYYTDGDARNSYKRLCGSLSTVLTLLLQRHKDISKCDVYHQKAESLAATYENAIRNLNMLRTRVLEDSSRVNDTQTASQSIRLIKTHLDAFTAIVDRDIGKALAPYQSENAIVRSVRSVVNSLRFALSKVFNKNNSTFFSSNIRSGRSEIMKVANHGTHVVEQSLDIDAKIVI